MGSQLCLQTTNQSLAHRLWRYATGSNGTFFPAGICGEGQAEEICPHNHKSGPCLVHLSGCTLSPAALNEWILSRCSSSAAILRVYWLGTSPSQAVSKEELVQQLLEAGPPADGGPLRLQCYPRSLEAWLGDQLPASFNLQPVNPVWVLHVVVLPPDQEQEEEEQQGEEGEQQQQEQGAADAATEANQQQHEQPPAAGQEQQQQQQAERRQQRILYSLQPACDLYNYSPVRGKRVPHQLSKAAGKLDEALLASGVQLTTGVAIDLGAAPGGWTHVLAQHARRVIAVDPADMDERALASGAVTHLACKAEDAVEEIRQMVGDAGVDLLVSDVNRHPSQIIDMMRPLLPLLHPGAAVIMTLKFFGKGRGREEWRQQLAEELGPGFERVQLLWLLANTQHEQTCVAFKAAAAAAAEAPDLQGCA